MGRWRRRATIARKAMIQILETAAEYGLEGEEWQILAQDMTALTHALRGVERVEEMELGVTSLERRQIAARERLEQLLGAVDSDPKGPENRPHYNNYQASVYPEQDTVIAAKESSGAGEGSTPSHPEPGMRKQPEWGMEDGIAPDELVRFAPKLGSWLLLMMTHQAETGGRASDSSAAMRLVSGDFRRSIRPRPGRWLQPASPPLGTEMIG